MVWSERKTGHLFVLGAGGVLGNACRRAGNPQVFTHSYINRLLSGSPTTTSPRARFTRAGTRSLPDVGAADTRPMYRIVMWVRCGKVELGKGGLGGERGGWVLIFKIDQYN